MTMPTPTVAKTQLIIDWLTGLGWNVTQETGYPFFPGPEILDAPDRMVTLTPTTGPGWVTEEGAQDAWGFQVRVRGADDDPLGPQLAAQQLDVLIFNGPYPVTVDGVVISTVTRNSPPIPLPILPPDRRFEYTCTYLITTGGE